MDIKQKLLKLLERRVFNAEELVEEIDKLYKQDQALQLQQTGVMRSAYWVELYGGNTLIVVADSVSDACDKLDNMNFENYSIIHEKTMTSLV